uniref:Uncharacterized protein n=1 Tax=Anguilla anguilla TaxID=7936 RepID=A0A0E9VYF3_ANGAN
MNMNMNTASLCSPEYAAVMLSGISVFSLVSVLLFIFYVKNQMCSLRCPFQSYSCH